MPDELLSKSATQLLDLIKTGAVSSLEVVDEYLRRIEQLNPSLNAIVTTAANVRERAQAKDTALAGGRLSGPLHGLPITIKDTIDTAGIRTTYGSRLFAEHVPRHDAAVVARLTTAGAIILGKTNVPEMAFPYETNNPVFGRTNNPHDLSLTSGGSSGGEAAAIAARLSPLGMGSDLSGSVRVPAHFCGIAALKTTSGAVSMVGHVPAATGPLALGAAIGPMARCVEDLALIVRVIAEAGSRWARESSAAIAPVAWFTNEEITPVAEEVAKAVERAADMLRHAGYDVRQEVPPGISHGQRLWVELFSRAAENQIREIYRGREDEAGPLISRIVQIDRQNSMADQIDSAEALAKSIVERERLREELLRWMRTTPLILAPVSATPAFRHGAERIDASGRSMSVFHSCSYSQIANVFGLPAAVVPLARTREGLPVGVQLMGRPFEESAVLRAAAAIEKAAGFY